ncbi:MAG TPA: ATP-binding protein [Acidimicrobiales bacterium]|nr:ATP-binding protein [Acidimicrobiales bacterium]
MRRLLVVSAVGLVAAWCLALAFGDSVSAATEVVGLATGPSLVLLLVVRTVRHLVSRRSLAQHLAAAVAITVIGIAVGVLIAGWRMFLSPADTRAVLVILVAAGTVGAVGALAMATRLNRSVLAIGRQAAALGQRPDQPPSARSIPTRELSDLAAQLHDVSERLHESILRERSLESSRRELVAWISHDLRTPLAGIRAVIEALHDGVVTDDETVRRYHETIQSEVERLTAMVDDLFRLSRIHAGLANLRIESANLRDLVSDALALATPVAEAKGIRLAGQVPDAHLPVRLAPTEFLRVLRNLLDNALRHTPEGGQVVVQARADDREAVVSVRDECGGIREADLERVFDLGYRGDQARSPGPGRQAGLGLAIAQGLVAAHGGRMEVSNEERGCRFTIRLPAVAATTW